MKQNTESEAQLVTLETNARKCSKYFKALHTFLCFSPIKHYVLFILKDNFLFHLFFKSKVKP